MKYSLKALVTRFGVSSNPSLFGSSPIHFNIVLKVPHAPFVVNSNCSWKNIPDYEDTVNITLIKDEETRVKGYIDNVNCVNSH